MPLLHPENKLGTIVDLHTHTSVGSFDATTTPAEIAACRARMPGLDGAIEEAEQLYLKAISEMESLRGNIRLDELQMSFGKDKYEVYENLVSLQLHKGDFLTAFDFVEKSKSRTLIDLLERNLDTVWDSSAEESPRLQRIRKIREELNILYTRLNQVGADPTIRD